MEIEKRMGFRVRSKYEDIVKWIQSDPPGVAYPRNRQALQAMESHVYAQLTAALSTAATKKVVDDFFGRHEPGLPPNGAPQGGPPPMPPPGPPGKPAGPNRFREVG